MGEIAIRRTTSADPDYQELVKHLDQLLSELNGEKNDFYAPLNKTPDLPTVVIAYINEQPMGIGAFRPLLDGVEIKRMFVQPVARGTGVARSVLAALETWASQEGFKIARLETSRRLVPAVTLYLSCGYNYIPNYEPYMCAEDSVCMEKRL